MDKKIKLGCIGLGRRGSNMNDTTFLRNSRIEVAAVCDTDPEAIERFKERFKNESGISSVQYFESYKDLIKTDVDAVFVATHIASHCDIAIDCLNAGKHVLCEIPNIANLEEAKKLKKAVDDNPNVKFMVAENCCYWAFIESWKEMYDNGMLGQIQYAESDYLHQHKHIVPNGEITWRSYRPAITYLTHNLGPLLYILGDRCAEVTGFIPNKNAIEDVHPAPAEGVAMIKTEKGTLIKIFIGQGVYHAYKHNFAVYGSKGSLENQRGKSNKDCMTIGNLDCMPYTHAPVEIPVYEGFPGAVSGGHGGADVKMVDAFLDCIINDTKPPLDIDFGIDIALSGIYADISSKNGGQVYNLTEIKNF